jgi:hypothetical protein
VLGHEPMVAWVGETERKGLRPEFTIEPSRARKNSWKLNVFLNQVVYECCGIC